MSQTSYEILEKYKKLAQARHSFPEEYFVSEERDGFYVEDKMKRIWAAQIEVLLEIESICRKYGIEYFAYSGTLLGAVRHKGFIPWDQDINIAMRREDYQRFLQAAGSELPEGWNLRCTARGGGSSFARVDNGDEYDSRAERLIRFHGCPYGVGVDIFPLDNLPDSRDEEEVLYSLLRSIYYVIGAVKAGMGTELEPCLKELEQLCQVKIERGEGTEGHLYEIWDRVAGSYIGEETELLASLMFMPDPEHRAHYKREWFARSIRLPFETITVPVPINYHEVLQVQFGQDYMIPLKILGDDYPIYKKMDEEIEGLKNKSKVGEEHDTVS